jgi:hypothetical protein
VEETEEEDGWKSEDGRSVGDEPEFAKFPHLPSPHPSESAYWTEKRENMKRNAELLKKLKLHQAAANLIKVRGSQHVHGT